jgi:hypothetical protein
VPIIDALDALLLMAQHALRNLDLPLAIGDPIATQLFLLPRRILASAWRPQRWAFSGIRRCGEVWTADTERTRFWSNCIKCLRYIRNILILRLNLVRQEGLRPERARQ